MDMNIGKNIRFYRELKKMTQKQFADAMGYDNHTTITKIEQGQRDVPMSKLGEMARILGVSPAAFFHDVPATDYVEYIENIRRLEDEDPEKLRIIREMLGMPEKKNVTESTKAIG